MDTNKLSIIVSDNDTETSTTSSVTCKSCGGSKSDSDADVTVTHDLNGISEPDAVDDVIYTRENVKRKNSRGKDGGQSSSDDPGLCEKPVARRLKRGRSLGCTTCQIQQNDVCHCTEYVDNGTRRLSNWSLFTSGSAAVTPPGQLPRQNIASMRRKEFIRLRSDSAHVCAEDSSQAYITPLQRKDQVIRDLKRELKSTTEKLQETEGQLRDVVEKSGADLAGILKERDREIRTLRETLADTNTVLDQLREEKDNWDEERDALQKDMEDLMVSQQEREEHHRDMYLAMFEKGQQSAEEVRQDEIEEIASHNPEAVALPELLNKLKCTQDRLTQLQDATRTQHYHDASRSSPTNAIEVSLRCVRDAMYHYLTAVEPKTKTQHLTVLLNLADYTEQQKNRIYKCVTKGKGQRKDSSSK